MAVSEDWDEKSSRSSNSDRDIDVISSNDLVSINNSVSDGVLEESLSCCLQEEGHESKLNVVLFQELFSKFLKQLEIILFSYWQLLAYQPLGKQLAQHKYFEHLLTAEKLFVLIQTQAHGFRSSLLLVRMGSGEEEWVEMPSGVWEPLVLAQIQFQLAQVFQQAQRSQLAQGPPQFELAQLKIQKAWEGLHQLQRVVFRQRQSVRLLRKIQ